MTQGILWQELYKAAMAERDQTKLQKRIEAAHAAIQRRIEELKLGSGHDQSSTEKQAIADALHSLRTLQKMALRSSTEASSPDANPPDGEES